MSKNLTSLQMLEAESIHILREVVSEFSLDLIEHVNEEGGALYPDLQARHME
jgi:hypothetical protein